MLYQRLAMYYSGVQPSPVMPFFIAAQMISHDKRSAVDFWADHVHDYVGAGAHNVSEEPAQELNEQFVTFDSKALREMCQRKDLDVSELCVTAYGKALCCLHGQKDVVFGHVIAARSADIGEGHEIFGPMFNTIPIRISLQNDVQTNNELVASVHRLSRDSIEHQHAPLSEVQKVWRRAAPNPEAPLIDSLFVYSSIGGQPRYGAQTLGQSLQSDRSPVSSEYPLNFEIEHSENGLVARTLSSLPSSDTKSLLSNFCAAFWDLLERPSRFATACPSKLQELPLVKSMTASRTGSEQQFSEDALAKFGETIRNAMAEVAQVSIEKITPSASIYTFGIDSIACIQIVSSCRRRGIKISVADILRGGNLGSICEIVGLRNGEQKESNDTADLQMLPSAAEKRSALSALGVQEHAVEDILPCLPGQMYHLLSWLQSGRTLYQPAWSYRASARLDNFRLSEAWRKLRERHSVLRTTFASTSSHRAVQVVMKTGSTAPEDDDTFAVERKGDLSLLQAVKALVKEQV